MIRILAIAIAATVLAPTADAQQQKKNGGTVTTTPVSGSLSCNKTTKNFAECQACGQRHGWSSAQAGNHCRKVFNN